MEINNKKSNWVKIPKPITIATIIASFVVFTATYFAMAENKTASTIFLDSDQDGLTNQEEKTLGTDPNNPDTDGDGYSDGKEVQSGYNPLKPAPGDQLLPSAPSASQKTSSPALPKDIPGGTGNVSPLTLSTDGSASSLNDLLSSGADGSNLTNGMVEEFMQLTLDKNSQSENFLDDPSFSQTDLSQVVQNALSKTDISKDMPEIKDSEMKILPAVEDKNLTPEEIKDKQKKEIEKYLSSLAFIFASNSPFPVDDPKNFKTSLQSESDNLLSAIMSGNKEKIDTYAQKSRDGIEAVKKVEIPFVLKDIHKSALQLAIYVLGFKDSIAVDSADPVKSLAALSSLQTTAQSVLKLQTQLQAIMDEYGIKSVEIKP
jgi:hypothetical protein